MNDCQYLVTCPFVKHCTENEQTTSVNGFIAMYCKNERQTSCIRRRLCEKFGREVVPKNMMPNGLPLPNTDRNLWSNEAANYRSLLND